MTGGLIAWSISAYEHIASQSLTALAWLGVGVALFILGAFLSWNEQYKRALNTECPEIFVSYERKDKEPPSTIYVKNLGGGTAYRVLIRPIRHYFSEGSFTEIPYVSENETVKAEWSLRHVDRECNWCSHQLAPTFENFINAGEAPMTWEEYWGSSRTTPLIVDYLNASGSKFTAEFEISQDDSTSDETHTNLLRRYFNSNEHTYFEGQVPFGPPKPADANSCVLERGREMAGLIAAQSLARGDGLVKKGSICSFCSHEDQAVSKTSANEQQAL